MLVYDSKLRPSPHWHLVMRENPVRPTREQSYNKDVALTHALVVFRLFMGWGQRQHEKVPIMT